MPTVISVENLSKAYRLGQIGTGTLTNDLRIWWAKMRGKPNPLAKIGQAAHGNRDGDTLWALKDVSFTVEQGEVLGVIGRNGAGKSTLLKILSRVTAPTSGQVKVRGRIASLLEVGTGFHPELTGRENIYLNGAILGMSRAEVRRKFDEIISFAEVEKFIDTPVKRYSSGMYVRLAFAVAAHLDPEILLVDEVLAVGDAAFQKKCLGKMEDVAHHGRTVLFVSHNMGAINELCSKGLLLNRGVTTFYGPITQCLDAYTALIQDASTQSEPANLTNSRFQIRSVLFNGNTIPSDIKNELPLEVEACLVGNSDSVMIFLIIEDSSGHLILHHRVSSRELGVNSFEGDFQLKITVPELWLSPGTYTCYLKFIPANGNRTFSDRYILPITGDIDATSRAILNPKIDIRIERRSGS